MDAGLPEEEPLVFAVDPAASVSQHMLYSSDWDAASDQFGVSWRAPKHGAEVLAVLVVLVNFPG